MIVTRDFFRFVESANIRELNDRKRKYQEFLGEMERLGSYEYANDAKVAIRLIDEEITARCEVSELADRRRNC